MIKKEHILSEIKRTATENNGKPLGTRRFEKETGIKSNKTVVEAIKELEQKDLIKTVEQGGLNQGDFRTSETSKRTTKYKINKTVDEWLSIIERQADKYSDVVQRFKPSSSNCCPGGHSLSNINFKYHS